MRKNIFEKRGWGNEFLNGTSPRSVPMSALRPLFSGVFDGVLHTRKWRSMDAGSSIVSRSPPGTGRPLFHCSFNLL